MGGLVGPTVRFPGEKSEYLRVVDGHLNSESVEKHGESDFYDSTAAVLNHNRAP